MPEEVYLDLETTYAAIVDAARKRSFISYGDLAKANRANWNKVRLLMPTHLDQLINIGHGRGWPIISAIVVNKDDLASGKLRGGSLTGFITAAKELGYQIKDPDVFLRDQQENVFAWASTAPERLDFAAVQTPSPPNGTTVKGPRFVTYFAPVLDAIRSLKGEASAQDVYSWVRTHIDVPEEELSGLNKGGQSKFENKVGWARFYLTKAGLLTSAKRGIWTLTSEGRETVLDHEKSLEIFREVQSQVKVQNEDDTPPEVEVTVAELFEDPDRRFWFGGALWDDDDQVSRFLEEGIWQNGAIEDRYSDLIATMKPGDRIAIKSSFVQKNHLPFDVGGQSVSCMRIKAIGTITENLGDRRTVKVAWDAYTTARDWYFYTYRTTLVLADAEDELARRLILFTFAGQLQDIPFWLKQPYFARKYKTAAKEATIETDDITTIAVAPAAYSVDTIVNEGCFLPRETVSGILDRLKEKKNLILQGPPGTGKTWLAKRLGFALMGSKDPKVVKSRLRVVQFHPSLSYEDFVRGWRPNSGGNLELVDGVFLSAVQAALSEPDICHVFIIEEINRGNPAQIFGDMLTLLENAKRRPEDALELAYTREDSDSRVHIPPNLYIIGTMNIADRSLALVDLALRRRFAFVTLQPTFGSAWRDWCLAKGGLDEDAIVKIKEKIQELNTRISEDRSLGPQYSIGHSYFTPPEGMKIVESYAWFRQVVETEIYPLLEEYWFDSMEKAIDAKKSLLSGL